MIERRIEFDGHEVQLYEWGEKTNPAIVCFHGLGNSGAAFMELADYLKNRFYILACDSPGHGGTAPFDAEEKYLFSSLAEWFDKFICGMAETPFYILGHSWGANLALHYAKLYPDKIKGVLLLDGGYTFPTYQEDMTFEKAYVGWDHYMDHSSVFSSWEDVKKEYQQYTTRWNGQIEQMVATLFKIEEKYHFRTSKFTALSIIKAFYKESFEQTYPYVQSPLLLIHATLPTELEYARVKGVNEMKKNIKNVTIVPMENTGHMIHWEQPEEAGEIIGRWIENIEAGFPFRTT